jgi:predicted integral membrane protein DUF2269
MPIADVQFSDVVKWLHITAVVVGLGATFAYGIFIAVAARSAPRAVPGVIAGIQATTRILVIPGLVLILATGIYLTSDRWDYGDFFVGWGIVAVLILFAMGPAIFGPNQDRALRAAEQDIERAGAGEVEFGPEFNRANGVLGKAGPLAGIIVILTVYVMAVKPFL